MGLTLHYATVCMLCAKVEEQCWDMSMLITAKCRGP